MFGAARYVLSVGTKSTRERQEDKGGEGGIKKKKKKNGEADKDDSGEEGIEIHRVSGCEGGDANAVLVNF